MKRGFLSALGLEKDIIDQIMNEHGRAVEALKERVKEGCDWKEKYEAELSAHKATRDDYAEKERAADTDNRVALLLKTAGLRSDLIPKALRLYDRSAVTRGEDGGIQNADALIESFKADWPGYFGEITIEGVDVGSPPVGGTARSAFDFDFTPVRMPTNN